MSDSVLRFGQVAAGRPYHAALVELGAGWRAVAPHAHADFYELMHVVSGEGVHRVGGARQPLVAGDLILVRPSDRHAPAGGRAEGVRFVNVAFPVAAWRAFIDLAGVTASGEWDATPSPPRAPAAHDLTGEFQRVLENYHARARPLDLLRLLSVVLPVLDNDGGSTGAGQLRPPWLTRACAAMNSEENLRGGLPRLLELAAVSHGHLARVMREHHGCAPLEYVTERQLAHASVLLATTSESVSRIADRCGFASLSYFGRRFRQRHGVNPRAYRAAASRAVVPGT